MHGIGSHGLLGFLRAFLGGFFDTFLIRYPGAFAPRLGQTDRNGLLTAFYRRARAAAFKFTALAFVHCTLHLACRLLAILGHGNVFRLQSETRYGARPLRGRSFY